MEGAIEWLAQTILETLSISQLQAWIRRQGLGRDIQLLESEVEMVDMVCAAVRDRAAGNKPLGRPLARLEGALYDADDLVDELDYYRLLDLNLETPPATASLVVGRNDTPIQSSHADMLVESSTADSQGNGLSQHDDIFGAVVVDNNKNKNNKSRTDVDIGSRQGAKTRSAVWQYFVVSEADEFERPVKAKCVKCASELNCGSKYGTSGLKRHIRTEACGKKREAADLQALIPSRYCTWSLDVITDLLSPSHSVFSSFP